MRFKTISNLIAELSLSYHVAHGILHVISALCAARDLHTIAPGPHELTYWIQFAEQ